MGFGCEVTVPMGSECLVGILASRDSDHSRDDVAAGSASFQSPSEKLPCDCMESRQPGSKVWGKSPLFPPRTAVRSRRWQPCVMATQREGFSNDRREVI
jgi:hypothetical protein